MKKIKLLIASLYLILAPYLVITDFILYDSKRLLQVVLIVLLGMITLYNLVRQSNTNDYSSEINFTQLFIGQYRIPLLVFSILTIAGLVSVILSDKIGFALIDFLFSLLLISLAFVLIPNNSREHLFIGKIIVGATVSCSTIYLVIFFGNYVSSFFNPLVGLWPDKIKYGIILNGARFDSKEVLYFVHKRFFNHTQTWTIPILIGFLCFYKNKYPSRKTIILLLTALVSLWWMLIFASGGRGSILGITASFTVLLVVWKKDLLVFMRQALISMGLGALSYLVFFKLIPNSGSSLPLLRSSDSGRFSMWESALDMWIQNPLFGAGPMHFAQISDIPTFAHPHNFYIQFLSEWGLIAFIALSVLIFMLLKFVVKNYPADNQKMQSKFLYIAVSWSILAAFIHAFFSGVLHTPISQIWFVLIVAWLLGFNRKSSTKKYQNYAINKYASVVYLVLIVTLSVILFDDILNLYQGYEDYVSKYPESKFYPRFWGQGLFE